MSAFTIIGPGRVGGAFAIALSRAGHNVAQVVYRNKAGLERLRKRLPDSTSFTSKTPPEISSGVVLIATGDNEISQVAADISRLVGPGVTAFHTSGSLASGILEPLAEHGCHTGSIHPLAAISDPISGACVFEGAYFCVEGSPKAVTAANRIVRSIGGKPFAIEAGQKALYHAAAVMAAGHIVALFDIAVSLLERCGLSRSESKRLLLPLLKSTTSNLDDATTETALTGPFARLDIETIERNLAGLRHSGLKNAEDLYMTLGEHSLAIVERRDGMSDRLKDLRKRISVAKAKRR